MNKTALNKSLDVSASCVEGSSYDDCAAKIKDNKADLVTLDGGHVYAAGNNVHIHGKSLSVTYFWIWALLRRCHNFKPSLCRLTQFHLSYDALLTLFLTISIHCQEIRLRELVKWSPKRKQFDRSSNSLTHSSGKSMETSLENLYVETCLSKVDPNRASILTQWILYFESRHALGLRLSKYIKIKLHNYFCILGSFRHIRPAEYVSLSTKFQFD